MRKKLISIIIFVSLVCIACTNSPLETYNKALNRTETISRGNESLDISVDITLMKESMSTDGIELLNHNRHFRVGYSRTFDKDKIKEKVDYYYEVHGMRLDGKYYIDEKVAILIAPMMAKMLIFDKIDYGDNDNYPSKLLISVDRLKEEFGNNIAKENAISIGDLIISTPDGEIKTKEFKLIPSDDDLNQKLKEIFHKGSQDEFMIALLNGLKSVLEIKNNDFQQFLEIMAINNFVHRGFIDKDNYVIEELISFDMESIEPKDTQITKISVSVKKQNWDINKSINVEFPEITQNNSITITNDMSINDIIPLIADGAGTILGSQPTELVGEDFNDNDIIILGEMGKKINDHSRFNEFVSNLDNGEIDKIRIIIYTYVMNDTKTPGQIINDLYFDGNKLTLYHDRTKDIHSSVRNRVKIEFNTIEQRVEGKQIQYYLKNNNSNNEMLIYFIN